MEKIKCDCIIHTWEEYESQDCEDCGEPTANKNLSHWKHEPGILLCESCYESRLSEEE
jgi:formylmethanofuran dehydrogenase subunit E